MTNLCPKCGIYRADKIIDPAGPFAICPECGHKQIFRQLPLLTVSGASGTGKSTVYNQLIGKIGGTVILDADILWRNEFNHPENNYREFMELWLRMCKNISQAGKPVVLFGSGTGVPMNIEPCVERRYFSQVHYLALVCEDNILFERLKARPVWRRSNDSHFLAEQIEFNNWFKEDNDKLSQTVELIDTTNISIQEAVDKVAAWINNNLI